MKYEMTRDMLAGLLVQAKKAHSAYEKELGHYDDNWSWWYAAYILDQLEQEKASS